MKSALVVDDDDLVRSTVTFMLQNLNFQVTSASEGYEAFRLLSQSKFDLVITDLFMPDVDGIEIILRIKKLAPSLPILLMTGGGKLFPHGSGSLDDLTESAKLFGAAQVIHKPFRKSEFDRIVHEAVPDLC